MPGPPEPPAALPEVPLRSLIMRLLRSAARPPANPRPPLPPGPGPPPRPPRPAPIRAPRGQPGSVRPRHCPPRRHPACPGLGCSCPPSPVPRLRLLLTTSAPQLCSPVSLSPAPQLHVVLIPDFTRSRPPQPPPSSRPASQPRLILLHNFICSIPSPAPCHPVLLPDFTRSCSPTHLVLLPNPGSPDYHLHQPCALVVSLPSTIHPHSPEACVPNPVSPSPQPYHPTPQLYQTHFPTLPVPLSNPTSSAPKH